MKKILNTLKWQSMVMVMAALLFANFAHSQDSKGTDFWVAFPGNYTNHTLTLFISGDVSTTGVISANGISDINFSVTAGVTTSISIPNSFNVQVTDGIENKGLHIVAADEVTVYGVNQRTASTDAFLALPTDILGTEHMILSYRTSISTEPTQLTVVASEDNTTITVTTNISTGARTAGVPYNVLLDAGEVYQLRAPGSNTDLTGTLVSSDKPVGVYGGVKCVNIGIGACDFIVEQLPPLSAWGKNFVTYPLETNTNSAIRILAAEDNTAITLNGSALTTLNKGQFYESFYSIPLHITADKPILVGQYAQGSSSGTGDPFFMLIPPFEQFLGSYVISTPATGFSQHYVNIIVPQAGLSSVVLDGSSINSSEFTAIGTSGFYGGAFAVTAGSHSVSSTYPIGVHSYGWGSFDSYGYPGGQGLSSIAFVDSLAIDPLTISLTVNDNHCITATILDNNGDPVPGIRVDFDVEGANDDDGFANTDTNGEATYCYTGLNGGWDTIYVSSGSLSDVATAFWASCNISVVANVTSDYNGYGVSCYGASDGMAEAVVTNGSGTISYLWSNGDITQSASNLKADTIYYVVTVKDENDCEATDSVMLTEPSAVMVEAGSDATVYYGYSPMECADLTGSASGGSGTYSSYNWSNSDTGTTINVCPSSTTVYTLTVTDSYGCSGSDSVTVNVVDVRCGKKMNKVLVCHVDEYDVYHNICVSANAVPAHLAHGDFLGDCGGNKMEEEITGAELQMQVFPNPFTDVTVVQVVLPQDGQATLAVYNVQGRLMQTLHSGEVKGGLPYTFDVYGTNMAAGVYTARLTTAFGVENVKIILIK